MLGKDTIGKVIESGLFALTTGNYEPGQAKRFCLESADDEKRRFALAELSYYRGELEAAAEGMTAVSESETPFVSASAIFSSALISLASGDSESVIDIIEAVKGIDELLGDVSVFEAPTRLALLYFDLVVRNFSDISFPPVGIDSFDVPEPLKPMAFYIYTQYLIETNEIGRAVGMAEGALLFMKKPSPISEIYLCLVISRGYMLRRVWDKAEYYFRLAWSLAEPDGFILPFAEFRGILFGMLEKCLRYEKPEEYKRIAELSNRYHSSWVAVHNRLTGEHISDDLTPIELNVASLAAKGLSNPEIAGLLGISVNSVRSHLRNIFNKLSVGSRKELDTYVF